MIFLKLKLKNFRQFYGVQQVQFAQNLNSGQKNITVIFGENGRGKTGIYRAIMFCLYGDHSLSQDAHGSEKELNHVNTVRLHEAHNRHHRPVECFVELDFYHNGVRYTLKRTMLGMLDKSKIIEERGKVSLTYRDNDGNTISVDDPTNIKKEINSILDRSVREYFLFDGEKIERLTRASVEQRKEISKGIRNLLDIDTLQTAKKAVARLQKNIDGQLEKRSTGDYKKILHRIKETTSRISQLESAIENTEHELELSVEEKRKIDIEFDKIKEIKDFLEKRSELENSETEMQEELVSITEEIKGQTGKASQLLIEKTVNNVFTYVDQLKQTGEIPSDIRKDLIEKILKNEECICGREVLPETDAFHRICQWKDRVNEVIIEDFMLDLWRLLSGVKNHFDDTLMNTETTLQKYAVKKNEVEIIRNKINDINERIGTSARGDAAKLQKHRRKIEEKIIKLQANHNNYINELDLKKKEYESLKNKRKEKEREENIKNELTKRADLASETVTALNNVYREFTQEIKQRIGKYATEYFKQFIDDQSRKTLKRIVVNDDYSIQILDKWEKPFLANISAGQRQILSIAFIAALAKAASKGNTFEMPFFMDTPFGRLSNEHRRNLIFNVPKIADQWILLVTDTEFRKYEARLLKKNKNWNNFYILKGNEDGITQLESCTPDEAFSYLKDDEDLL